MASADALIDKYSHYVSIGHGVYAVTLSTYVKCRPNQFRTVGVQTSDRWRVFWDHHFIYGVRRSLPFRAKLDHDWVLEESPDGYFHYHGLLAVDAACKDRFWTHAGLNKRLRNGLDSFRELGKYRPFRINKYLIEPIDSVASWTYYSTKQNAMYLNTNVLQ